MNRLLSIALLMLCWISPVSAAPTLDLTASNTSPVVGGSAFGLSIAVTNPDAAPLTNVVLTLPLPAKFVSANNSPTLSGTTASSFSCTTPPVETNGTYVCRAASMASGGTFNVTFTAGIPERNTSGNSSIVSRMVSSGTSVSDSLILAATVDAALTTNATLPSTARVGQAFTFQLSSFLAGSSSMVNPSMTLTLPTEVELVSLFGSRDWANACTYNPATRDLRCTTPWLDTTNNTSAVHLTLRTDTSFVPGPLTLTTAITSSSGTISNSSASDSILIIAN